MRLSFRTAGRIAWRETRSSMSKFLFVVLAVAMGVGALSGVRGFSQSVRTMLNTETRTIMAADLTARQFAEPGPDQLAQLDALAAQGIDRTQITETVSMASTNAPDAVPVLVSIKAVDPAKYPYYGTVGLSPAMRFQDALKPDAVVAGEDVFIRLGVKPGDKIRLGSEDFTMAAIVTSEPDRMSGSLNVGLRMMISREGFERTGLMQVGSRAAHRYLFKLNPGAPSVQQARERLSAALPGALIADSSEAHPLITRGLNLGTTFLSLVSLIALIVGAIGVGMAMYAHIQQKMDTIAVMKTLGATSGEIIRIYTLQTLMLGLLGGIAGVVLGRLIEEAMPALVSQIFEINAPTGWHVDAAVQGIITGVLTTLLFTVPPLLAIRKIRPALILRRDMPDAKLPWRDRLRESRGSLVAGGVILAGLGAIAGWLAGSPRVGAYFAAGLFTSLLALSGVAWALLRGIKALLRHPPMRIPALTRQGLANLHRQGNQAQAILTAMGIGVMFTLSVYLVQSSVIDDLVSAAPPDVPNVFLVGVTPEQVEPVKALIAQQPGILTETQLGASVSARLMKVDGEDTAAIAEREGMVRRLLRPRSVTWEPEIRPGLRVVEGEFWKKGATGNVLSIDAGVARWLDVGVGSQLDFEISGRVVSARIVAMHVAEEIRYTPDSDFVFNPPALAGLPVVFYGGVRVEPKQVGAVQRAIFRAYPTITVINIADALAIAQQVIDQVTLVIQFLSGFAILAGAIILAASVAGTRFRRIREVVILKTLGATRRHVSRIFSVEFLVLGGVAGLLGAILAGFFSGIVLTRLMETETHIDWAASAVCVVLTALLANIAGWAASFRILGQKPLEVLRDE